MMQSPILKITGLHKSFGDNEVLKGIDLSVNKGQLVFMIGPSGSGKTVGAAPSARWSVLEPLGG
jgi:ABC-type Fe3+/spermidine/putrescine transport system ATPase subunit